MTQPINSCLNENGETKQIKSLDFNLQSLLFGELSYLAYHKVDEVAEITKEMGFVQIQFFEKEGAQGYIFQTAHDLVVAFRGTEFSDLNDIKADLNSLWKNCEPLGRVHLGFLGELEKLWGDINLIIEKTEKTIWFTGHSLGAGIATLAAAKCSHSLPHAVIGALFTYASPRAGLRDFVERLKVPHYRWVNNADIITTLPLALLGFKHHGICMYFNTYGNARNYSRFQRLQDRFRGIGFGFTNKTIKSISDHRMGSYVERLAKLAAGSEFPESGLFSKRPRCLRSLFCCFRRKIHFEAAAKKDV
jgi:triacylglycerol lipase